MKKIFFFKVALFLFIFSIIACNNDRDEIVVPTDTTPTNGWRIGTTNYTTVFSMRNIAQPNSIGAFDAIPTADNLNSVVVLFNNTTGIAAGTFKVVTKPEQSDLLADEIMVSPNTGYNQTTGLYNKQYVTALDQTVNATVTITNGKVKVVVPQINIISYPITSSSVTSNFAGTIIEQ